MENVKDVKNMVKFVIPTKKIEVEPTKLDFIDNNKGIILYPDGNLMIFWGFDEFYEEHMINITNKEEFDKLFGFVYKKWESKELHKQRNIKDQESTPTAKSEVKR